MGLQLIFAVETNRKCKSDWIYIRDTIDRFYEYENTRIKHDAGVYGWQRKV